MQYDVTFQVKNEFNTVTVEAKNEKDAWGEALKLGISNVVTAISLSDDQTTAVNKKRVNWMDKLNQIALDKEYMLNNHHEFVCRYVALMTTTKYHRSRVDGYQLKQKGSKYQIFFNNSTCGYPLMDASTTYTWLTRIPLCRFQVEADQWRISECSKA